MNKNIENYEFIKQLQTLPFIDEIWLFGSRARDDNTAKSDIDLAILCPNATNDDWLTVMNIIQESDTLLKIDCVRLELKNISKGLYNNILKDRKVIYVKVTN